MIKTGFKKIVITFGIPLIASLIGAVITLVFYPFMQDVEYRYWQMKNKKETNNYILEKRIKNIKEFHTVQSKTSNCFSKVSKETQNKADVLILPTDACKEELLDLWNIGFEANVYFNKPVNIELQNLNTLISMYLIKANLSPFRTEEYIEDVNKSMRKTLKLMQENLYNFSTE